MKAKRVEKRVFWATIGTLFIFFVAGALFPFGSAHAKEKKEVVLGSLIPFTGSNASWGIRQDRGLRMMIEKVNAEGGIKCLGGVKIKYVVYDTESKPEVAGMQAEKLASIPNIVMITGAVQSPASVVASQVTERAQIPYLDTSGIDPLITSRGFKYVFRTPATIKRVGIMPLTFAEAMNKKNKTDFKKIAILCEDTLPGKNMAIALKQEVKALDYELIDSVLYNAGATTDFIGVLSRFKAKGANILVGHNKPADAIQIVRNLKELNYNLAMVGGVVGGYVASDFLPNVGDLAEGIVIAASESTELKFDHYKKYRVEYEKRFKDKINTNVLMGWAAVTILKDALERSCSTDPKEVAKALRKTDLGFGEGYFFQQFGVKFGENGDNLKAGPTIHQIINGVWVNVFPDEIKERDPIWPRPKFK